MSGTKSQPLTKEEVMQLINLVDANSVVTSKATNASNNQLKEAAWLQITTLFNAVISSCPRKPDQLRLKWENLKKAARKRSTKIRMNNLKTGGGKPDYIPPDDALDKVTSILGATCEGYSVPFGGDAEVVVVDEGGSSVVEEQVLIVPFPNCGDGMVKESSNGAGGGDGMVKESSNGAGGGFGDCDEMRTPKSDLINGTPTYKKIFFNSNKSKGKQKTQKLASEDVQARINRNNAIADYYISKKNMVDKSNEKIKLEIDILNLQKNKLLDV